MECPACGHENRADARYCRACGIALENTTEALAQPFEAPAPSPEPPQVRPSLRVINGSLAGSAYALTRPMVRLGRDPSNEVFLDDVTVSRRHAEMREQGDRWQIIDLGSLNGTYVEGVRIEGPEWLHESSRIRIGRYELIFHGSAAVRDPREDPAPRRSRGDHERRS